MASRTIKQVLDAMLVRREYCVKEVKARLLRLGYMRLSVDAIIEDYVQRGLLSDSRYVEEKVRSLMQKGYGPMYIGMMLKKYGLSINPADYDWTEAYQIANRKAGSREGIKRQQYLYRRGFMVRKS